MPVEFTIEDIDLGWKATFRNLAGLDDMRVEAGLFDEEQALKGAWNEFGAKAPARPWLSVAADTSAGPAATLAGQVIGQVADRKITAPKALDTIGRFMRGAAKSVIEQQRVQGPPLAPSTVQAKGSPEKLIGIDDETGKRGTMMKSIDYQVTKDGASDE